MFSEIVRLMNDHLEIKKTNDYQTIENIPLWL